MPSFSHRGSGCENVLTLVFRANEIFFPDGQGFPPTDRTAHQNFTASLPKLLRAASSQKTQFTTPFFPQNKSFPFSYFPPSTKSLRRLTTC